MFGILMKVRLSHTGGVISPVENEFMSCQSESNSNKSPSERLMKNLRANQSYGMYIIFSPISTKHYILFRRLSKLQTLDAALLQGQCHLFSVAPL